eukprot:7386035-Prymnesium_polylepis.2
MHTTYVPLVGARDVACVAPPRSCRICLTIACHVNLRLRSWRRISTQLPAACALAVSPML